MVTRYVTYLMQLHFRVLGISLLKTQDNVAAINVQPMPKQACDNQDAFLPLLIAW
jgi:hypothetical protein